MGFFEKHPEIKRLEGILNNIKQEMKNPDSSSSILYQQIANPFDSLKALRNSNIGHRTKKEANSLMKQYTETLSILEEKYDSDKMFQEYAEEAAQYYEFSKAISKGGITVIGSLDNLRTALTEEVNSLNTAIEEYKQKFGLDSLSGDPFKARSLLVSAIQSIGDK